MRLIDKDKAIASLSIFTDRENGNEHFIYGIETARDFITDCCEEIDAVPVVRGEWIQKHHIISLNNMTLTGTYPTCNLCDYAWIGVAKNTNYCPNCGCDMRGESNGKE